MLCYKSIVKNVMNVVLFFFLTIPLFLAVIGSSIIFYYFISANIELTPKKL